MTWSTISDSLGVSVSALRRWAADPDALTRRRAECPRCGTADLPRSAYSALLGYYLGDGHIAPARRSHALRIGCDRKFVAIINDVENLFRLVHPSGRSCRISRPGCIDVQSQWMHWPCLFPQHGPGRKDQRRIVLHAWQQSIVEQHPSPFLRGLFHSDGCRTINTASRRRGSEVVRHRYPRWQFTNASQDIRELCSWALDLVGICWRQSNARVISVSRRDAVRVLDALIGCKA